MVVTLTGDNAFMLRRELDTLVATFAAEHGDIAVERLDAAEASFERIQESLQSLPFLADRKLVVVRTPGANKRLTEEIESLLTILPETTDVILVEPKPDKRSTYYKSLKKHTDLREQASLDVPALARWLSQTATEQGGSLSLGDARFLVERVGTDQQLLAGELDKLLAYRPDVATDSIELLSEPTPQSQIFDLLEAAFSGDMRRALLLYRDQREQKIEPGYILGMLVWQFKMLAFVETAGDRSAQDIARDAGASPYVIQKSQFIARRLSLPRLRELIRRLLELDARSKRQNLDLDEALQAFLLEMAQ